MNDKQLRVNKFLADLIDTAFMLREYNPGKTDLKIPVGVPIELVEFAFDLLPEEVRKAYFDETFNIECKETLPENMPPSKTIRIVANFINPSDLKN